MHLGRLAIATALLAFACAHEPAAPAQEQGFSEWLSQARGPIPAQRTDAEGWKPAPTPLMTRWGRAVRPDNVLSEHPRPQFARATWASLNGLWEFAEAREDEAPPCGQSLAEQILVPFPMESALSGIGRHHERAWYRRTFEAQPSWRQGRLLLHFEAVDWRCTVWLNGQELGTHEGGYDAFTFDVTDALGADGLQELVVGVFDPTESGDQPRGKQTTKPEGIWYTPSSGIWQTVWLEPVPRTRIQSIELATSVERGELTLRADTDEGGEALDVTISAGGKTILTQTITPGAEARIALPDAHAWSPADPFLYDLRLDLRVDGPVVDSVSSYFGLREIAVKPAWDGVPRIFLNGELLIQIGVLDQGFWPDGLYTAPSDEALRSDIELAKRLGMNLIRKHVKVEPERWYAWCDRLGMLVWQDLPSSDDHRAADPTILRRELDALVSQKKNHPCIVDWVVFNEGWGQFATNSGHGDAQEVEEGTARLVARVRALDPTRLVTAASGWTDTGAGDLHDIHVYPGPAAPDVGERRAGVLGEFGGLGLAVDGHRWQAESWGYKGVADSEALTRGYEELLRQVWELAEEQGLCAAVYTQTSDVETECNGLVTYDREIVKIDVERVARASRGEVPVTITLVPDARRAEVEWRYSLERPAEGWTRADFDDSRWLRGKAGFGTQGTPGARVRTEWNSSDIWLRREFELTEPAGSDVFLAVHHDEDCEIHINDSAEPIRLSGYTTGYQRVAVPAGVLRTGTNRIAVHCHQTTGGQYFDAGVVRLEAGRR